jgi:menaquinone-dependent protoporphyrinogen oxidase
MKRALLLYASHHGQTRSIAEHLAARLSTAGIAVELADVQREPLPSPTRFDAVILGSRIELGRHASALLAYIRAHRDELARVPTAFFSVSMAAAPPSTNEDPSGYLAATFDQLGWHPTLRVAFAGGLPYRRYGLVTRFVMKRIARTNGHPTDTSRNHELTSWPAVERFADQVAALVSPAATRAVEGHA